MVSIYPPILDSSQSAFLVSQDTLRINYTLPSYLDFSRVKHAQILICYQTSNRSVADTSKWFDGVIYQTSNYDETGITLNKTDLIGQNWETGILYRIQVRFGTTNLWGDESESFANWKRQQIEDETFSEWSNVMVTKAITAPSVKILNQQEVNVSYETSSRPIFYGEYYSQEEFLESYQFMLYKVVDNAEELIESSSQITFTSSQIDPKTAQKISNSYNPSANYFSYMFKTVLTNGVSYRVKLAVRTINGYESSPVAYDFEINEAYLTPISNLTISVVDGANDLEKQEQVIFCRENGCIQLYFNSSEPLNGNYVISRTSELTDFTEYEDIKFLSFKNQICENSLVFTDYAIESGIKYRYAVQYIYPHSEGDLELRTAPLYSSLNGYHSVDFEYSYFYHDDVQLRLMLNEKINSFKHTVLRSKQDTLGSKYPYLSQNGNAYYAEFGISGLISYEANQESQTFLKLRKNGMYYQEERAFDLDKFTSEDTTINHDLTDSNIFIERKFREKVEAFLNNFDYKLFKSPTEGNIIVVLTNVTLTPVQSLGRMLYEFSATAYEVYDNSLENLVTCGIVVPGSYQASEAGETFTVFGQLPMRYNASKTVVGPLWTKVQNPINLNTQIGYLEAGPADAGFKYVLDHIEELSLELYPRELRYKGIPSYATLKAGLAGGSTGGNDPNLIKISVGGNEILVIPNHLYKVDDSSNVLLTYANVPVLVNYKAVVKTVVDAQQKIYIGSTVYKPWGQVSGEFEGNNWFTSLQAAAQAQAEAAGAPASSDYEFGRITKLDIEAPEGTALTLGDKTFIIGHTGHLALASSTNELQDLSFVRKSYAIINYECTTYWKKYTPSP